MSIDIDDIKVTHNEAEQRYEAVVEGQLSVLEYERDGERILMTHVEVPRAQRTNGIAAKITQTALDEARAAHLSVVPLCPYVVTFIRRHQDYLDIVDPAYQARVRRK